MIPAGYFEQSWKIAHDAIQRRKSGIDAKTRLDWAAFRASLGRSWYTYPELRRLSGKSRVAVYAQVMQHPQFWEKKAANATLVRVRAVK
jgi:hypothetical protein